MPNFTLICDIAHNKVEDTQGMLYAAGMNSCMENSIASGTRITGYFTDSVTRDAAFALAVTWPLLCAPICATVEDQDWNAAWRAQMEPVRIAHNIWVAPTWLTPPLVKGDHWIRIEPKMAFGTGHHETTRLAAQAIFDQSSFLKGKRLLDIGTGSGVLCFVADLAGTAYALGCDIDPLCCENLAENLADNPPQGAISFCIGTPQALIHEVAFDAVVMNMIYTESAPCFEAICKLITPKARLIWSGILAAEDQEAITCAQKWGFSLVTTAVEGEWWCGVFQRD